jgi:hypothetical protein
VPSLRLLKGTKRRRGNEKTGMGEGELKKVKFVVKRNVRVLIKAEMVF